jgi:ActR/RegA family two-component response regulator
MDILLIEDNDYRRITILKYLLRCGHRVTPCSSVSEAEEILQFVSAGETPGDVVIVAYELMSDGGAGLRHGLRERAPEMRWILLPADRGVAWLADRLANPADDDVMADETTDVRLNILIIEPDDRRRSAMVARVAEAATASQLAGSSGCQVVLAGITSPAHAARHRIVHLHDGDGLSFYLAASRRFPDIRWIVTPPPQLLPVVA